ncbi:MAG TPA: hypothetical protein PK079_17465 [Leptospiraceae bacterium]|nr:hypothetical protein [Leptospiraceae bacterium]HMW06462.1 hypothetical protein [Leptospiraceae bacterium]HMX32436.1 hypothetical protein [Leptospiraceae bacterium]HMY33679.1 hypothetical protein [Leptospiraceae bacterium]HMZ65230.1 hypothetical protein [Leptospiraceae bacterium]
MNRDEKVIEIESELCQLKLCVDSEDLESMKRKELANSLLHKIDSDLLTIQMDSFQHSKFNIGVFHLYIELEILRNSLKKTGIL